MKRSFFYFYVFFTGAAVMSIEMTASRLIAPYFGTSLMVWANIIGIILLAMSGGYVFGGRIADRYPKESVLFTLTLIAGVILTCIPFYSQLIFRLLTGGILATPTQTIIIAFAAILLVFAPPIFLLAMVSPYALRLASPSSEETGKVSGRLYAYSTLGSLIGTFLPALVLIPQIGTRHTIFLSAFILVALSALGLRKWWAFMIAILPLLFIFLTPQTVKASDAILWQKETPYQYVQVIKQSDDSVALVYNEGGGVQSIYRPNHQLFSRDYYNYYLLLPFLREKTNQSLWILGSAGGTMLGLFDYWVRPSYPNLQETGVEIDPEVIPLGQKFFGLTGNEGEIVNSDARTFINSQNEAKADLIIIDAYSQQIYIPFHLSTREFYQKIHDHLNTNGILALNVNAISASSRILQTFERTLISVYKFTYVMPVPGSLNYVLLASDSPISTTNFSQLPAELKPFADYFRDNLVIADPPKGLIFTDDKAPVEFLTDQMIWQTILNGSNPY